MSEVDILSLINLPVVAVCFIMGYVIKNYIKAVPNKYIPLIMLILGAIAGVIVKLLDSDTNITNAIISGAVSGLASTGSYEFIVNTFGLKTNNKEITEDVTEDTTNEEDELNIDEDE